MRTIWKYEIKSTGTSSVFIPIGSRVLSVQVQGGKVCFWAEVWQDAPKEERKFKVVQTGGEVNTCEGGAFIGTFQLDNGDYVGHVYELPKAR